MCTTNQDKEEGGGEDAADQIALNMDDDDYDYDNDDTKLKSCAAAAQRRLRRSYEAFEDELDDVYVMGVFGYSGHHLVPVQCDAI